MRMRKLATIRTIQEIRPIVDADAIEQVRVDGWWVVCKKSEFSVGQKVLYLEIDSWVPHNVAPFLSKGKEPKEYNGVKGQRLRTVKLRGALSQGLILNPNTIPEFTQISLYEGEDFAEMLGVVKWEPPPPKCTTFKIRGNFPSFIPKTDQERIQNKLEVFNDLFAVYEVTLKLDGSSMTVYCVEDEEDPKVYKLGVCSRNLDIDLEDYNKYVITANNKNLLYKAKTYFEQTGHSIAFQGELMGPGIQGNPENLEDFDFYCFDIFDITEQKYMIPFARRMICKELEIKHVPVIKHTTSFLDVSWDSIDVVLEDVAKIKVPEFSTPIEGIVLKSIVGNGSFKIINNEFLLSKKS